MLSFIGLQIGLGFGTTQHKPYLSFFFWYTNPILGFLAKSKHMTSVVETETGLKKTFEEGEKI